MLNVIMLNVIMLNVVMLFFKISTQNLFTVHKWEFKTRESLQKGMISTVDLLVLASSDEYWKYFFLFPKQANLTKRLTMQSLPAVRVPC
jgi:hypothetical protein